MQKPDQLIKISSGLTADEPKKQKYADELTVANNQSFSFRKEKKQRVDKCTIDSRKTLFKLSEKQDTAGKLLGAAGEKARQNKAIERRPNKLRSVMLELEESEQRYSDLFHLSPMPRWVYDPKTCRCIQVNKAAIDMYGYSEQEFLTMNIDDLRVNKNLPKTSATQKSLSASYNIPECRQQHYKKSGTLAEMELYSNPIQINNIEYCSVVAIDITEKIMYEHRITRAIIKTQEEDRYEIGAELHDNICQILATSLLSLRQLKNSLGPSAIGHFENTQGNILLAATEIRNLSHRLAPAFFEDSTMKDAFKRVLKEFNANKQFEISLDFDKAIAEAGINMDLQLTMYRILQEQLSNILKHAKAAAIAIRVYIDSHKMIMKIIDNGVGFSMNTVSSGIGIANMRRRAELFMGKLIIQSAPAKGCKITVEIPLRQNNTVNKLD